MVMADELNFNLIGEDDDEFFQDLLSDGENNISLTQLLMVNTQQLLNYEKGTVSDIFF